MMRRYLEFQQSLPQIKNSSPNHNHAITQQKTCNVTKNESIPIKQSHRGQATSRSRAKEATTEYWSRLGGCKGGLEAALRRTDGMGERRS